VKTAEQYEELKTPCQVSLVFELISPLFDDKRVLDVGCATGEYLSRFSLTSVGLDYSNRNLAICRDKGLTVLKADFNEGLPVESESFDVAFCSHVIEHVDSPIVLLREMRRVVQGGGTVIVAHPVEFSLARVLLRDHYFRSHPSHLYSFSLGCMSRLMEKSEIQVHRIIFDFPLLNRFHLVPLLRLAQHIPRKVAMLLAGNVWFVAGRI